MQNVEQTIISQYGNSATITALIYNMNDAIDPAADLDNFYSFVWNVETAVGFGLDIWGRIVNVSRYLQIPETANYFGFNEAGASAYPFNEYPFYSGIPPVTNTYFVGCLLTYSNTSLYLCFDTTLAYTMTQVKNTSKAMKFYYF